MKELLESYNLINKISQEAQKHRDDARAWLLRIHQKMGLTMPKVDENKTVNQSWEEIAKNILDSIES